MRHVSVPFGGFLRGEETYVVLLTYMTGFFELKVALYDASLRALDRECDFQSKWIKFTIVIVCINAQLARIMLVSWSLRYLTGRRMNRLGVRAATDGMRWSDGPASKFFQIEGGRQHRIWYLFRDKTRFMGGRT
jgi:hypothetical protein